jgi:hypothetical protein
MAVQLTGVDRLFWVLCFCGHCILLVTLIVRRRVATLPVFTSFIVMNIVRTVVLYVTLGYGSKDQYFYAYWSLAILDVVLQFALAYELAAHVFRPLGVWAPDVRQSFIGMAGASLLIAFGLTWLAAPPTHTLRLAIVLRGDFFASVLLSELFVAMIALSVTLGLPWRTHVARVAQGIGIFALTGLLTDAARTYFGTGRGAESFVLISQLQNGLYLVCLSYWMITLAQDEPAPRKLPEELHNELRILQTRAAFLLRSMRTMGSGS